MFPSRRPRRSHSLLTLATDVLCVWVVALSACVSMPSYAESTKIPSLRVGLHLGGALGNARVVPDQDNEFTDHNGIGFALGLTVEKTLSQYVHLSGELHALTALDLALFSGNSSSAGGLVSVGAVFGSVNVPRSPYFAASLGYSRVSIGKTGEPPEPDEDTSCGAR